MSKDYYQKKLKGLKTLDSKGISASDLAERVYYMYLAQQEQINALQDQLAKAKMGPAPQPMLAGDNGDDPCCCGAGHPIGCPPICVQC